MTTSSHPPTLPFASAEGTRAERRVTIGNAIARLRAANHPVDLHVRELVLWVFNSPDQELVRSYKQLAAAPWGLCCSHSKARAAVQVAVDLGLLQVERKRFQATGDAANRYRLDWDGIRAVLAGSVPHRATDGRPTAVDHRPEVRPGDCPTVATEQGGVATEQGGVATEQGPASPRQPYSNYSPGTLHNPPPPTPSTRGVAPRAWREVEVDLSLCRVADVVGTLDIARRRLLAPEEVLALASYYRDHADQFDGPGALCYRVRNAMPGQSPAEGWPSVSDKRRAALAVQAEAKRRADFARDLARQRAEAAAPASVPSFRALREALRGDLQTAGANAVTTRKEHPLPTKPN